MRKKINTVSCYIGIPSKKILDFFNVLQDGRAIENNELVREVGVSRNVLNQIKYEFSEFLRPVSKSTQINETQVKKVRSALGEDYAPENDLWKILESDEEYLRVLDFLKNLSENRPEPIREYDQFTATVETTSRRVMLLKFFDDIAGKRLLFLGDDDFTSVAAAGLGLADSITVLDVDDRLIESMKKISKQKNLGINIIKHDLRKKIPEKLRDQFDVVFTDPPYTELGIQLFLSRAVDCLDKDNKAARVYLCYGNSDKAKERFLPVQKILIDSGFMIRWIFDKFNRYSGAESIGSTSSILILDSTPKTKILIKEDYGRKPIYTNN